MENLDDLTKKGKNSGFVSHVFNFDEESKDEFMNIIQYSTLAIIPVIIFNKVMNKIIPDVDETKGNIEIIFEILFQNIIMFISIILIHRIITYIPTYSGSKYNELNVLNIVIITFIILFSIKSKLGLKISLLYERLINYIDGKTKNEDKQINIKVSKPIDQNQNRSIITSNQISNNISNTSSISSLPPIQSYPNYDNMYRNDDTPLINANTPGTQNVNMTDKNTQNTINNSETQFEVMAANEGGAFATPFSGSW